MKLDTTTLIIWLIMFFAFSILILSILIAIKFQKKQSKKVDDINNIIKEKNGFTFAVKDSLTIEDIKKIDSSVNYSYLCDNLYNKYINFEEKLKNLDDNLDNLLTGYFKDFTIQKIKNFKMSNLKDQKSNIDLLGYAITKFSKNSLEFRINIKFYSEKSRNVPSYLEQIILVTYKKQNEDWLISSIDTIYEKKL